MAKGGVWVGPTPSAAVSAGAATVSTVQSLLTDVGHEDSGMLPRTSSFGEALRKRYREDEDEEEEPAVAPSLLPRVAL